MAVWDVEKQRHTCRKTIKNLDQNFLCIHCVKQWSFPCQIHSKRVLVWICSFLAYLNELSRLIWRLVAFKTKWCLSQSRNYMPVIQDDSEAYLKSCETGVREHGIQLGFKEKQGLCEKGFCQARWALQARIQVLLV